MEKKLEDWQQRVVDEKKELDVKVEKITDLIMSKGYEKLPIEEKKLLLQQVMLMGAYLSVLEKRILFF